MTSTLFIFQIINNFSKLLCIRGRYNTSLLHFVQLDFSRFNLWGEDRTSCRKVLFDFVCFWHKLIWWVWCIFLFRRCIKCLRGTVQTKSVRFCYHCSNFYQVGFLFIFFVVGAMILVDGFLVPSWRNLLRCVMRFSILFVIYCFLSGNHLTIFSGAKL